MNKHPAQFSDELLIPLERAIRRFSDDNGHVDVVDPFAGPGIKMNDLCQRCGWSFFGMDIEAWDGRVDTVMKGDATDEYDWMDMTEGLLNPVVVTSPTYGNGLNDSHDAKDDSKRFTYRNSLGRQLNPMNSGRYGIRQGRKAWRTYWRINSEAMIFPQNMGWPVILNVKAFIHAGEVVDLPSMWEVLLITLGFGIDKVEYVETPGIRFGENADRRVSHETIITAVPG